MTFPKADRLKDTLFGSFDLEQLPRSIKWSRLLPPATERREKKKTEYLFKIYLRLCIAILLNRSYCAGTAVSENLAFLLEGLNNWMKRNNGNKIKENKKKK